MLAILFSIPLSCQTGGEAKQSRFLCEGRSRTRVLKCKCLCCHQVRLGEQWCTQDSKRHAEERPIPAVCNIRGEWFPYLLFCAELQSVGCVRQLAPLQNWQGCIWWQAEASSSRSLTAWIVGEAVSSVMYPCATVSSTSLAPVPGSSNEALIVFQERLLLPGGSALFLPSRGPWALFAVVTILVSICTHACIHTPIHICVLITTLMYKPTLVNNHFPFP